MPSGTGNRMDLMETRSFERTRGSDAAGSHRSSWTKRVALSAFGTAGAGIAMVAFAAAAFANAPNPTSVSASASDPDAQGRVTVTVSGTWSWEAPASPSPQTNCDGRYGAGWAVDWWGINKAPQAINGLSYQVAATTGAGAIATNGSGQPFLTTSTAASPAVTLTSKTGTTFHASKTINGWITPLCTNGRPIGNFSSTATYPNAASVPDKICVNFYDLHGSPGQPKLDDFFSTNGDNSIKTNAFDPATVNGNCSVVVPQHPSVKVDKTNDANGDGSFGEPETAPALSTNVPFKVVITNNSTVAETIDSVTDAIPTGSAANAVSCLTSGGANVVNQTLNPGASVTCFFTKNNYLAANGIQVDGSLEDDVKVNVHSSNGNQGTGHDTSLVNAPAGQSNVTVAKTGPATGDLDGNGTYKIVATNSGNKASAATTFTDTLPDGESFVSFTGPGNCAAAGQVVTCNLPSLAAGADATYTVTVKYTKSGDLKDCATINGQAVPSCVTTHVGEPNVTVKKTGPAKGDLDGNGTYTIVATNTGDAASKATTFTDTLPVGETFVSSTGPGNCSAVGQVVTCNLPALDAKGGANDSRTYTVTVKYTKSGDLTDCATINGQQVPSCVTTHVGEPNVTVKKTGPAVGLLNDQGTYTLVATNDGDAPSKATTFTDTLPDGEAFDAAKSSNKCSAVGQVITCQLGALDAKGGAHDSASFTVVVTYTKTGDLTDCATINGQPVPSCVTTHVVQPKLQVKKTGPATGTLNGNGTYTLVVTNNGDGDSLATTFTDTLPAGESFVSSTGPGNCAAAGQVVTCDVPALAKNGGSVTYTVTVKYTKSGNLTDCATIAGQPVPSCVTTHIPGEPSLLVVKTNDADGDGVFHDTETAENEGDAVTFKVVITNTSGDPIAIDTISDAFDVTTLAECPNLIGTVLDAGDSVTCTFTVADYAPAAGESLLDTVTVGGHQEPGGTPVTGTDTSTVKTRSIAPDLAIVKTADQDAVDVGDTLTYTLEVTNVGGGPTTGAVTVTDSVPDGLTLVSVDGGSSWDCSVNGQDITCTYLGGVIDAGETVPQITIVTTATTAAVPRVVNTGVVSTPGDNNPTNDRSTVETPVTNVLGERVPRANPPTEVLPFTGDRTGSMLPVGVTALLLGTMLVVAGRRRRRA